MKKTTIRLALFSAGLLILCISVIFNPSCIALIGENITGLVYGLGIVLLTVGIFFPGTNSLALLDKQVPEHSELKAAVAGILISLGLVSLFSFIVSLLGIIYFKDVVPSEHFFAVCSALSLATANNFCLGYVGGEYFVKPIRTKMFDGIVIRDVSDLNYLKYYGKCLVSLHL
jgi:hypothetical protein